jgi:hypothetical protein
MRALAGTRRRTWCRLGAWLALRYEPGMLDGALKGVVCVAAAAALTGGCAEQRQILNHGPTAGVSPCSFWPPPPSALSWVADEHPEHQVPTSVMAAQLETDLRSAGYSELRWYPIGLGHRHGFAVTTRVESLDRETGKPSGGPDRWLKLYPEPAGLRWLALARKVPLPRPGRYGALLIAFTDLPHADSSIAPRWNEDTVMAGPGVEEGSPPSTWLDRGAGYRLGVHVYLYERDDDEEYGQFRGRAGAELHTAARVYLESLGLGQRR